MKGCEQLRLKVEVLDMPEPRMTVLDVGRALKADEAGDPDDLLGGR